MNCPFESSETAQARQNKLYQKDNIMNGLNLSGKPTARLRSSSFRFRSP